MSQELTIIVGAGLSGLACAIRLLESQQKVLLLEASDSVGGRLKTDLVDGFRLDHGFQVLQTAYPEAKRLLDYGRLDLRPFAPGAIIRTNQRFVRMSDPWRRPQDLLATLSNGIGSWMDRWRLAKLRRQVQQGSIDDLWQTPDKSTAQFLVEDCHFTEDFIKRFIQPWYRGIFLERELETSHQFFRFVFRMLSQGDAALPAMGMQSIAIQLAERISNDALRLNAPVVAIEGNAVKLQSGESISGDRVVLAVESTAVDKLVPIEGVQSEFRSTTCLYFAADAPPTREPFLYLNGDEHGPIDHLVIPSNVAPSYAPANQSLISVSIVGIPRESESELRASVRKQLTDWFGNQVSTWRNLPTYFVRYALPSQLAGFRKRQRSTGRWSDRVWICGDHCERPRSTEHCSAVDKPPTLFCRK